MTPEDFVQATATALRRFWAGRGVVLLLDDFDTRATTLVDELRSCGAYVGAVVARTGPAPGAPDVPHSWLCSDVGLQLSRPDFETWLRDDEPDLRRWLNGLDPAREWLVLGTPRTGLPSFCDRVIHGWRRPTWAEVEDKTTIDVLWAEAGVSAPPHVVVPIGELSQLPESIAGPDGVVVAADSSQGYVGDTHGLRWVPCSDRFVEAVLELTARANRVRVARFADGVPCSVLGMALPDGLAIFSPIEIVTLGDPDTGGLLFCGSSTHWRPGRAAEEQIRKAARRAGTVLVRRTRYRGIFSIDGLLTAQGFMATELNPRHASGLGLRAALPDLPVYLFNRAVQEEVGGMPGITARELERLVRTVVAGAPSYSLSVPATGRDGPGRLRHDKLVVDYQIHGRQAILSRITPAPRDGRAGPACAALAAHLHTPGLCSFPLRRSTA
jgi:hypothetical protein